MSRGIGEFDPLQDQIPEWGAVVIALLTQLGDVWFLTMVLALLYWVGTPSRAEIATVGGVWLTGMGLYKGLKDLFAFPRPDEPLLDPDLLPIAVEQLYELTAFASGYGFPSGHAVNTTIVYFGLATVLEVGTRRLRYLVAGFLVGIVGFTRIALGVHYLVDIVVGIAVGAAVLIGIGGPARRHLGDAATGTLAAGTGMGVFFFLASDGDMDAVFLLAASLGAFAGWQLILLGNALVTTSKLSDAVVPVVLRGGLAIAGLVPLVASLEYFPILSVYAAGGVAGLGLAVIVTIPVLRHSPTGRRVGSSLAGLIALVKPRTWRNWWQTLRDRFKNDR